MHGKIFQSLKNYIVSQKDAQVWETICSEAGLSEEPFLPIKTYPDEKMYAISVAAAKHFHQPLEDFLEQFGVRLMEDLIDYCHKWIDPSWKCLDFLMNTECVLHSTVKKLCAIPGEAADPPHLEISRLADNQLTIVYTSPRKLCALAKGLLHGAAIHYHEDLVISETRCMHQGHPDCFFVITKK